MYDELPWLEYKKIFNAYQENKERLEKYFNEYEFFIAVKEDELTLEILIAYELNSKFAVREIADVLNVSEFKIRSRMAALREKGFLVKVAGKNEYVIDRKAILEAIPPSYIEYVDDTKEELMQEALRKAEEERITKIKGKIQKECAEMAQHIGAFEDEPVYINSQEDVEKLLELLKEVDYLDYEIENSDLIRKYLFAKRLWNCRYTMTEKPEFIELRDYDIFCPEKQQILLEAFLYAKTKLDAGEYVHATNLFCNFYGELVVLANGRNLEKTVMILEKTARILNENYCCNSLGCLLDELQILYKIDDKTEPVDQFVVCKSHYGEYVKLASYRNARDYYFVNNEARADGCLVDFLYKKYLSRETSVQKVYPGYSVIWDAIPLLAKRTEVFFASRNIDIKPYLTGAMMDMHLMVFPEERCKYDEGLPGLYNYLGNEDEAVFMHNGVQLKYAAGKYWFPQICFEDWQSLTDYILRLAESHLAKKINYPKKIVAGYRSTMGKCDYREAVKSKEFKQMIEDAFDEFIKENGRVLEMYHSET